MRRAHDHCERIRKRGTILILGLLTFELAGGQTEAGKPPPLKLPDVVIYGRDVLLVARSKGLEASYAALPIPVDAPTRLRKEDLATIGYEKAIPGRDEVRWKNWMVEAQAGYGSFSSASFALRQGLKMGDLHYLASVDYERFGDWVPNSSQREGNFRGKFGYQFLNGVATSAQVGFHQKEFGYYGSPFTTRGKFTFLEVGEKTTIDLTQALALVIDASFNLDRLDNPNVVWLYGGPRETEFEPGVLISLLVGEHSLRARCEYEYERHFDSFENEPLERQLLTVGIGGDFRLPGSLLGSAELAYQDCGSDNLTESKARLNPRLRISYPLSNRLIVFASYEPKMSRHSQSRLFSENNYFSGGWGPVEDRWLDLSVGVQAEHSERMQGQLSLGMDRRRYAPHWWNSSGTFYVSASHELEVSKGRLGLRVDMTEHLTVESTLLYESIRSISPFFVEWEQLPYCPKERAEVSLHYTPLKDLEMGANLSYQGRRYTDRGEELAPFVLAGLEVSKGLFRHFGMWGRIDNLLNTSYEIWEDYPMPGRALTAGLNVKW